MSHVVPPWRSLGGLEELWVWWLEGRQVTFFSVSISLRAQRKRGNEVDALYLLQASFPHLENGDTGSIYLPGCL